jgi:hypothetical protein
MWDELRTPEEIEKQLSRQVTTVAHTLAIEEKQIFPCPAKKGWSPRSTKMRTFTGENPLASTGIRVIERVDSG